MNASQSLTDDLASQLQGAPLQQIAQQLGVDPSQANAAVGAALPLLMGALGRNASQPQGAQALFGALQKDHAGLDLGSVLGSVLGGGGGQGEQILGHVLGDREPRAQQALGQATGLGSDKANMLLRWLAPIVMAYLAKRMFNQRQGNAAPASGDGTDATPQLLGDILGQEEQRIGQQGGVGGGVLNAVLDKDADGDVDLSDLMNVGRSILGGLPKA